MVQRKAVGKSSLLCSTVRHRGHSVKKATNVAAIKLNTFYGIASYN